MKKKTLTFFFFGLILSSCASNTVDKVDVLKSTNISEIEEYLGKAHPEDPKTRILKQRIIALKNAEWTKGAKNARPVFMELPDQLNSKKKSEANLEVFKKLMSETSEEHREKTKKLLNNMFNEDITHNEAILLLKNNSDCNLVLEISGKKFYNLAVPAKGENFIVLNKDTYTFSGNVCDVKYQSSKEINKSLVVVLQNPGFKATPEKELIAENRLNKDSEKAKTKQNVSPKRKKKK
ncbi:DUF6759 domain-containing protein [Chryseobacterium scophthalmum]|uniref:DUF6759 domain-containing protein n=1 Tax=Chryseobacterium scophthalmum TaxID=59733 RepID=A0A1N6IZV3_9FLAO|nr:DUF6759 domain-containing protein [Chryseobacterium scophthalmum]SIO37459.1 hypothetical protein SAMN05421769_3969 [Chryseobacterium scophthalmum]